jgi:hypothetical protein
VAPAGPAQAGQAGAEVLLVSAAVLFAVVIIILRTWAVVDVRFRVTGAAREAVRAYVESPVAREADEAAMRAAMAAMGVERVDELVVDRGVFLQRDGGFARCERVRMTVRWTVPAMRAWGVKLGTVTVRGSHSEVVDPYRNGRNGLAGCGGDP